MAGRFSIYSPGGRLGLRNNPFGKDVANLQLFRALAQHGDFDEFDLLSLTPPSHDQARADLVGERASATVFRSNAIFAQNIPAAAGVLLRGSADLHELAWLRRQMVGDRAYSLISLIHTMAPPAIRAHIADSIRAPTQPWDAIICTSPSVEAATRRMLSEEGAWMAERTGGRPPPMPALPVVPLGVDGPAFAARRDRPQVRLEMRESLGLRAADILVLWVGRLSFFEKAFPQAMFRALQAARAAGGPKLCFAMAGWFPDEQDKGRFEEAAAVLAPSVDVRFMDGNDATVVGGLWAAADIFISLVDNIQETFGITPVEAMAAGLPVVVSDWDGYRFTVRDGVEGFLIPTLGGPQNGQGRGMAARHIFGLDAYQTYVGDVAQHTAVHVGRCAEALSRLIADPELRRRMGEAGRQRVREMLDWPVVVRQLRALADDLARVRQAAPEPQVMTRSNPVKGDPFRDFAGFASQVTHVDMPLAVAAGITRADFDATAAVRLDNAFPRWRASREECARAFELIAAGEATSVRQVLLAFPVERRRPVEMGLVWMAKLGLLDWLL